MFQRRLNQIPIVSTFLFILHLVCFGQATPAQLSKQREVTQDGNTVHLSVNSPRPLADALTALQRKYGWLINYEDPAYTSKSDYVESTDARYVNPATGLKPHVPNGGAFTVDFPAGAQNSAPDEKTTLQLVVDAYNRSNNPGRFEIHWQDARVDVVGSQTHDDSGKWVQVKPVFNTPVTLKAGDMSAIEEVNSICDQIGASAQQTIAVGVNPRKVVQNTVNVGVIAVPAREALAKVLTATGKSVFWRLLYDPDTKGYVLNLHIIN